MTRPGLRTIDLTSHRAAFRRTATYVMIAAALVAAVGYVLPAHRLENYADFHSNLHDGSVISLFVLGAVAVIAYALRNLRLGSGMITGIAGAAGAIGALLPVFLVHLFSHYDVGYGDNMFWLGELVLFFTGLTLLVAEPLLYVFERRRIERDARPAELPMAAVVSRA